MPNREPRVGEITDAYPYGYGFCQCGCKQMADRLSSGDFRSYLPNHYELNQRSNIPTYGKPENSEGLTPSSKTYVNHDKALVELHLELLRKHTQIALKTKIIRVDVELAVKLVNDFWSGPDDAKHLILEKLEAIVGRLKSIEE